MIAVQTFELWHLLVAFTRAGVLGYGGGVGIVPLFQIEVVRNYHWMTSDQFAESIAVGYALPGPIATKLAGYIGYKVAGWLGAVIAITGISAPTALATIMVYGLLVRYRETPVVGGIIAGVQPVVFVLLALMTYDYLRYSTASWVTAALSIGALVAIRYLGVHPTLVVLASMVVGAMALR